MTNPSTALIVFLATRPTTRARLLAEHRDDGTGHCRTCTIGGQAGHHSWPCSLGSSARAAEELALNTSHS